MNDDEPYTENFQEPDGSNTEVRGMRDVSERAPYRDSRPAHMEDPDVQEVVSSTPNSSTRTPGHQRNHFEPGQRPRRYMQARTSPSPNQNHLALSRTEAQPVYQSERNHMGNQSSSKSPVSHPFVDEEVNIDGGNGNDTQNVRKGPRRRPSFAEWDVPGATTNSPTLKRRNNAAAGSDVSEVVEVTVGSSHTSTAARNSRRPHNAPQGGSRKLENAPRTKNAPRTRVSSPSPSRQVSSGKSRRLGDKKTARGKNADEVVCVEDEEDDYKAPVTKSRRTRERYVSHVDHEAGLNRNRHPVVSSNSDDIPQPTRRTSERLRAKTQSAKSSFVDTVLPEGSGVERPSPNQTIDLVDADEEESVKDYESEPPTGLHASTESVVAAVSDATPEPEVAEKRVSPEKNIPAETEDEPVTELFVYPPTGRGKIRITSEELKRLKDHQYLNDSLIDFYVKYLEQCRKSKSSSVRNKASCLFFSSFFFGRLRRTNPVDYEGVKRWTNTVDLFEKQFVFVPLCDSYHWSLIIVANLPNLHSIINLELEEAIEAAEDMGETRPKIIYMDSLEPKRGGQFGTAMIQYLCREWIHRKVDKPNKDDGEDELYEKLYKKLIRIIKVEKPRVPIQSNEYDCGLYVLNNIACFLEESNGMREEVLILGSQSKKIKAWYTHSDIHKLRDNMMHLISEMEKSYKLKRSPPANGHPPDEETLVPVTDPPIVNEPDIREKEPESSGGPVEAKITSDVVVSDKENCIDVEARNQLADKRIAEACVLAAANSNHMILDDDDECFEEEPLDCEPPRNASDLDSLRKESSDALSMSESPSGSPSNRTEGGAISQLEIQPSRAFNRLGRADEYNEEAENEVSRMSPDSHPHQRVHGDPMHLEPMDETQPMECEEVPLHGSHMEIAVNTATDSSVNVDADMDQMDP